MAWQLVHSLLHEFKDHDITYFGITPNGKEINTMVDIKSQAFCILIENFGSQKDLLTSQTNLGIQLLIHGMQSANKNEQKIL